MAAEQRLFIGFSSSKWREVYGKQCILRIDLVATRLSVRAAAATYLDVRLLAKMEHNFEFYDVFLA
jgi:hypothetical protein